MASEAFINGKEFENNYKVLSIQSHVVSGYCGNKSAVFPLQTLGFEVDFVNSVQFSNHTGYGKWTGQVLEAADIEKLWSGLKENHLDSSYTHILTGYARSPSFLNAVHDIVTEIKAKSPTATYVCDPVLGDHGKLYVPSELVEVYRDKIIPLADVLSPNQFEAEILTGVKIKCLKSAIKAIDVFHSRGIKTVVMSSADFLTNDEEGSRLVSLVSSLVPRHGKDRQLYKIVVKKKKGCFIGTGDMFAALFLAWFTKTNSDAKETIERVMATIQSIIERTLHSASALPGGSERPANIELKVIQSRHVIVSPNISIHASEIVL